MVFIYHNRIEAENVEIYGSVLEDDHIGAGYNIGDLLNIPSLGGYWLANPHNSYEDRTVVQSRDLLSKIGFELLY